MKTLERLQSQFFIDYFLRITIIVAIFLTSLTNPFLYPFPSTLSFFLPLSLPSHSSHPSLTYPLPPSSLPLSHSAGDITGACDMIQDVHVETYGSLSKKEKAEYILQQIRLNLLKKDYVRALIQSR